MGEINHGLRSSKSWISLEWNAMVEAEGGPLEKTSYTAWAAASAGGRDSKVKMLESHSPTLLPLRPKVGHRLPLWRYIPLQCLLSSPGMAKLSHIHRRETLIQKQDEEPACALWHAVAGRLLLFVSICVYCACDNNMNRNTCRATGDRTYQSLR